MTGLRVYNVAAMTSAGLPLRLLTLALLGVTPLVLSTTIEDVFFYPWRVALGVFAGGALLLGAWRILPGAAGVTLSRVTLPWALFGVWTLAGCLWSANPGDASRRAIESVGALAAVWLALSGGAGLPRLVAIAVTAATACSLYGISQTLGFDPLPWSTRFGARSFGTLGNPNYYAGHLLLLMPVCAAEVVRGGRWRIAAAGCGAAMATGFLMSQTRGAWLAAGAAAAWAGFWIWRTGGLLPAERRILGRIGAVLGIGAAAAAAAIPGMWSRLTSILAVGGYDSQGRQFLWAVARAIWSERPFTGFGTGSFKLEFPRHQFLGQTFDLPQFRPYNYSEHAHSELLQFGAELGWIGVALFSAGWILWLVAWVRALRAAATSARHDEWWRLLAAGTGLAGAFAYTWVNFPFQVVPTALLIWALAGATLARMDDPPAIVFPRPAAWLTAAVIAVFAGCSAYLTSADLVGNSYIRITRSRLEVDDPRGAYHFAQLARRAAPNDYRTHRWLARIATRLNDEALAEESYVQRRRIHPHLAESMADRADFYRRHQRNDEALAKYQELLAIAPNFVTCWGEVGAIRFERKEYALAIAAFAAATHYHDASGQWHHNLAAAFGTLGRYAEALAEDTRATEVEPGFVEGWVGRALSCLKLNRQEEAAQAIERIHALSPGDPRIHALLGQLGSLRRTPRPSR